MDIKFYDHITYHFIILAHMSHIESPAVPEANLRFDRLGQLTDIVVGGSFYNDQALRITCAVHMAVSIMKSFRQLELDNYIKISFVSG